ncbi:hypothetical protein D1O33_24455 (plasmid) [Rhodococcus rhodochrous]|uniref:protein kinase domain-containing protein n=1 Tax=Rhodococcus rhodochrous TaxID=1829 RepID=UPI00132E9E32|nr:protein kinase [Rhodococcus rhodochrous]QHG85235.1 hypothetical protein D1O33_24455 [Rhodococcus rhodochrous]
MAKTPWRKSGDTVGDRWTLIDKANPYKHLVWYAADRNGDPVVVKFAPDKGPARKRFSDEVRVLAKLAGKPGILPVCATDTHAKPKWFVMPKATPLAEHLRTMNVNDLVQAFIVLAETLSQLHKGQSRIVHRDIKPDNLFWYDGSAVFGDFGIADWEGQTFKTEELSKVGPLAFLAPEALNATVNVAWCAADVYSLTKTMWSLAEYQAANTHAPVEKILFPPQGEMNATGDWAYSLAPYFGPAGRELDRLIQDATSNAPNRRPTASEFKGELAAWLHMQPGLIRPQAKYHRGTELKNKWENFYNRIELYRQTKRAFIETIRQEIRICFPNIRFDDTVRLDTPPEWGPQVDGILDPHGRPMEVSENDHDGSEPDPWGSAIVLQLLPASESMRIIIGAIFEGERPSMDLIAELQSPGDNRTWSLTRVLDQRDLSPGWPAATAALRSMLKVLASSSSVPRNQGWAATRIV